MKSLIKFMQSRLFPSIVGCVALDFLFLLLYMQEPFDFAILYVIGMDVYIILPYILTKRAIELISKPNGDIFFLVAYTMFVFVLITIGLANSNALMVIVAPAIALFGYATIRNKVDKHILEKIEERCRKKY